MGPRTPGWFLGGDKVYTESDRSEVSRMMMLWHEANQHAILARRYDQGMYRPWLKVWDDPNTVPDSVSFFDLELGTVFAVLAASALAGCWIIARVVFRGPRS